MFYRHPYVQVVGKTPSHEGVRGLHARRTHRRRHHLGGSRHGRIPRAFLIFRGREGRPLENERPIGIFRHQRGKRPFREFAPVLRHPRPELGAFRRRRRVLTFRRDDAHRWRLERARNQLFGGKSGFSETEAQCRQVQDLVSRRKVRRLGECRGGGRSPQADHRRRRRDGIRRLREGARQKSRPGRRNPRFGRSGRRDVKLSDESLGFRAGPRKRRVFLKFDRRPLGRFETGFRGLRHDDVGGIFRSRLV